jgi:hypothetical protein
MKLALGLLVGLAALGTSAVAFADGQPSATGSVYTTHVVEIVGRGRPIAAIEVSREPPSVKLLALKQRFVERVESDASHDPF